MMLSEHLTFLSEAASTVLTAEDPDASLPDFYHKLSTLIGLEVYLHYRVSRDGTHLELAAAQGLSPEDRRKIREVAMGDGVCGQAAHLREPVHVPDVQQRTDDLATHIRGCGLSAYICHPLIARGQVLGTLAFGTRRETTIQPDVLTLLGIVCRNIAAALERKQSDTSLHAFDRRLRLYETVLSNTVDLVYVFDLHHRFSYANEALLRMWGKTWDEAIGKTCLQLGYEADHAAMHDREIEQVIATKQPVKGEVPFSGTGGLRLYEYIFVPVLGLDDEVEAVAGTTRDVTERAETDAVRAHLAALVNSSNDAIIGKTLEGIVTSWNGGAERLFGYPAQEAIGQSIYLIIPSDRHKEEPQILERIRQGERIEHYDTVRQRKNGSLVDISLSISPIIDEHGRVIGISKVARDITERKRTEQQLKELTAHLEDRVAERTKALTQSREKLRSLAADLTVTEERERRRIAEELHDHLAQLLVLGRMKLSHVIRQVTNPGVAALLHDIDDVIAQSMTYTRSLVVKLTPPVLHELGLLPALQWLATWMHDQGLSVSLHLPQKSPALAEVQAILLFQSVRELLFNVLKHAGIRRAAVSLEEDQHGVVRVTVSDEGRGFHLSEIENTGEANTHFGLFSIKERIESLRGRMEVSTKPGQGTRVTLVVQSAPATAAGTAEVGKVTEQTGKRLRVLLVDDHAMVREGLRSILESYTDLEVVGEAGDGIEAVKLARSRQPDVVVMDINMPRMDGIAATRQIKRESPATAVIGISVQESAQAEQAMLTAGATKFLTKDRAAGHLHEAILHTR